VRVPVYLREAIPALQSNTENVDLLEKTLNVIERLIRNKPDDIDEMSEHLIAALLHLSDQYNLTNFASLRHKAMVALTVNSPKLVVGYLTSQFYKENYNMQQRMDILDVLSDAAQELANIKLQPEAEEEEAPKKSVLNIVGHTTKKFSARKVVSSSKNNFLPLAKSFFFPLVEFYDDSSKSYLNLVTSDSILLNKLINTLATFLECIGELVTVDILPIYKTTMDIIWALRYHEQTYVRRAVLFALLQIALYLNKDVMLNNFIDEITELKNWLDESFQLEQDEQLLHMAITIQRLLTTKIARGEFVNKEDD
jgi:telomere length regulation protein